MRCVTPVDLIRALAVGGGSAVAARMLGVSRKTIARAMLDYGIQSPRRAQASELISETACRDAYAQVGPNVRTIAVALGLRDHKYVLRQLERYGIRETPEGPCVGEQMRLAREPLIRDATGRYVRAEETV
jgi:hypothetical protein